MQGYNGLGLRVWAIDWVTIHPVHAQGSHNICYRTCEPLYRAWGLGPKLLKGGYIGDYLGSIVGVTKGDAYYRVVGSLL